MKNYELTLILSPELNQEALNKVVQDIIAFIQEKGGLLEKQELKGKPFAYTKGKQGILAVLAFSLKQDEVENLTAKIKGEKDILRSMFLVALSHKTPMPTIMQAMPKTQTPEEIKLTVEDIDKKLEEIFKNGSQ